MEPKNSLGLIWGSIHAFASRDSGNIRQDKRCLSRDLEQSPHNLEELIVKPACLVKEIRKEGDGEKEGNKYIDNEMEERNGGSE
jgi:hypothetical protein